MAITHPIIRKISGGISVGDATANAWDIKNGKTAYIASGKVTGSGYFPAMMEFDGSTGYYSGTYTSSGNKITVILRFARLNNSATEVIFQAVGPTNYQRATIQLGSGGAITAVSANSAGTNICRLNTLNVYDDGDEHLVFYEFDADAGTGDLVIDGTSDINTGSGAHIAPTTGTLDSGGSSEIGIGSDYLGGNKFAGSLRTVGMHDTAGLTQSDFSQTDNSPKNIESTLSTVWGTTPRVWHESAFFEDNQGSAGAMTKNGTITLAAASSWS